MQCPCTYAPPHGHATPKTGLRDFDNGHMQRLRATKWIESAQYHVLDIPFALGEQISIAYDKASPLKHFGILHDWNSLAARMVIFHTLCFG